MLGGLHVQGNEATSKGSWHGTYAGQRKWRLMLDPPYIANISCWGGIRDREQYSIKSSQYFIHLFLYLIRPVDHAAYGIAGWER
jgi:hypothetical protein